VTSLRLFEISKQLRDLAELSLDEDIPPEVLRDTLEAVEGDFDAKAVDVAKFICSLEANAAEVARAAEMMATRAKRIERRAENVRAYLLYQLQSVNKARIATPELTIKRATNPPAVQIRELRDIPDKYWVQPPPPDKRIDKNALKADLKAGIDVPGAYIESSERLDIKL